jgi:hypothetical protein
VGLDAGWEDIFGVDRSALGASAADERASSASLGAVRTFGNHSQQWQ